MTDDINQAGPVKLKVNRLDYSDITKSMQSGLEDFRAAPVYGAAFGLVYAAIGWLMVYMLNTLDINYYVYPVATGFALLAPFAASGIYEISHSLSENRQLTWRGIFISTKTAGGKDLNWMAVVTTFSYIIWMDIAVALYVIFFGMKPVGMTQLLNEILTTPSGAVFFILGNLTGAVLALIVYSITVISMPLLFDKNIDFVTAMITSVNVVLKNPKPMLLWCIITGVLLAISLLSIFVALIVVLPFLGHSTWHLYKRAVAEVDSTAN